MHLRSLHLLFSVRLYCIEIKSNKMNEFQTVLAFTATEIFFNFFNLFCFSDMLNTCDSTKRPSYVRNSIEW